MAAKKTSRQRPAAKPSRIDAVRELVGVLTDAEVAAKAGVTSSAVHQYRQRHGIKPALPQGTTRRALERRKGSDEAAKAQAGAARRGRGLPRNGGTAASGSTTSGSGVGNGASSALGSSKSAAADLGAEHDRRRSKIDDYRDLVGVLTDPEVAQKAGVTRTAVQMYRKKHGIPPAGPPGDPAVARSRAPSPSPAARKASGPGPVARSGAGRQFAFKVTVSSRQGEVVKIIVADDAAVAAERARSLGDVVGIERLGEAM